MCDVIYAYIFSIVTIATGNFISQFATVMYPYMSFIIITQPGKDGLSILNVYVNI